ncbi:hypothetical protein [Nitrosopumilus sp.]|uniref:hypothetical protein n=1 Tax=Nitrosopumilus sp. TaxID=2024843 RepID=UPI00292F3CC8|nr:hypothetical protein [Nitrosopumilus sp.]
MSESTNTLYFDHEGDFEISVDNGILFVDMSSIQKIVFTDHTKMIRYTFSKFRIEMIDDICNIDQPKLQSN